MTASSSTTAAALVTGSLLVAAAGLYLSWSSSLSSSGKDGKSKKKDLVTDIDDLTAEEDYITAQEVSKIFDRLFTELQQIFAQLMHQIQQIQAMGQKIPQAQLEALMKQEMERALAARQKLVLDEFDMDYECLEEATWEFLQDEEQYPAVKRAVDRFQKFWESTTGQKVSGWRKWKSATDSTDDLKLVEAMSPEKTIEAGEKYFSAMTVAMQSLVKEYKEGGKDLQQPSVQNALQMDFASKGNNAGDAALEEMGVSVAQFEASIKAHSQNENVGRALAMMQMQMQQGLQTATL